MIYNCRTIHAIKSPVLAEREKYYKVNDTESTHWLHQSHRGSKQKPKSIGPQNQMNNHDIKKNKMSIICLFIITLINITPLLLSLLAIVLSAIAYKRLPTALPAEAMMVLMQLDSNNNDKY